MGKEEKEESRSARSRAQTRKLSRHESDTNIRISLCPCTDPHTNMDRLRSLEYKWTRRERNRAPVNKLQRLRGLIDLLQHLPRGDFPDYLEKSQSESSDTGSTVWYQKFEEAFQLYSSHITEMVDQNRFVLDILDQEIGLAVNIIEIHRVKYIVLNNAPIDLPTLFIWSKEIQQYNERNKPKRLIIGKQLMMRQITGTMDTEYDKSIAKWIFCINMSHSEMINIRVDPQEIMSKTAKNLAIIDECENSVLAAQDTVRLRLKEQIEKIESEVKKAHAKFSNRRQPWNQPTIAECEDDTEDRLSYKRKLEECISNPESSSLKMRVVRMQKVSLKNTE